MTSRHANDDGQARVHVVQGDYVVTNEDVILTTILGSCVAACIRDPLAKVGGMNHFLLPDGGSGDDVRYGVHAMELLVNGLLSRGARRERLEAKLFGGARMVRGLADIGGKNAEFGRRFLAAEGITLVGESLGGNQARRIQYWALSGRARQHLVDMSQTAPEEVVARRPREAQVGAVELF